jgi:hypothetical protein
MAGPCFGLLIVPCRHWLAGLHWPCRPESVRTAAPDGTCHNRTVLSLSAVASSRPSGLNAKSFTALVWPESSRTGAPVPAAFLPSALRSASRRDA